jgi:hypothetical protein
MTTHTATTAATVALSRPTILLLALCSAFVGFFVAAELMGGKLFEFTLLGLRPADLGLPGTHFIATTGVLAFPLTFIITDLINEYYGRQTVRLLTIYAIIVNILIQPVVQIAMRAPAPAFQDGMQASFAMAFGQSWAIVTASLVAFAVGQWCDAYIFSWLRARTGRSMLWLRAQGSTAVSQAVDTLIVIFLAFVIIPALFNGPEGTVGNLQTMTIGVAFIVCLTNYIYKFAVAVGITPTLYLLHFVMDLWLGRATARAMVDAAHQPATRSLAARTPGAG